VKKETKSEVVKDLEAALDTHSTFYLVDFKRMKVSQTVELRKLLRKNSFVYKVVKNRLALRALRERCPAEVKPFFEKPTAIAFAADNPIGLAKILKDFSAQGKVLAVKAGVVEGQYLASERFDEISRLSSRNDLVAKIGFLMAQPLVRLMRTLQAPLGNMGNLLTQLKTKKPDGQ
jgi:large subunit ribosomal protein L10